MFVKKRNLLPLILLSLSYTSFIWGDGYMISNGSCKFDREMGYQESSIYIKDNESFLIVDGGDSRYGTISTVYNAITCKEITSGEKTESDFSGLMERKGFTKPELNSKYNIDKSFQNKITFLENNDEIIVHVEFIDNSVRNELNTLLSSISDKSASSKINISNSAKKLLGYEQVYSLFLEKLNSLSDENVNYDYALSLNKQFKMNGINAGKGRGIILARKKAEEQRIIAKQEAERRKILAKQEAEKRKILAKQEAEKRKILAQEERAKKLQKVKLLKRSIGRRVSWYGSHKVDTDDCVQLYMFKKCMWVTYKYKFQGVLKAVDESSYTIEVTGVQLSIPSMVSMKYKQFQQQGRAWGEGQNGSITKVSINREVNVL